jgi:hypothetical protein
MKINPNTSNKGTAMSLRIDEEFRTLIPALTTEEYNNLQTNIIAEGCREKLITWDGAIIDGHNRYEICTMHNLKFETVEMSFADRDAAKIWIIRNQFGRRNLSPMQRTQLVIVLEPLIAAQAQQGKRSDLSPKSAKSEKHDTREELAKLAGVSHDTISKVKKINAKAVPELAEMARTNTVSINAAAKVADLPEDKQREAVEAGPEAVNAAAKATPASIKGADIKKTDGHGSLSIGPITRAKIAAILSEVLRLVNKPSTQISIVELRAKIIELDDVFSHLRPVKE